MKVGIGSYTFGWATGTYGWEMTKDRPHLSAFDLLQTAHDLDVEVVQIVVRPNVTELSDRELKRLAIEAARLRIDIELGTLGSDPDKLLAYLECANRLDAKLVRTLLSNPSEKLEHERADLEAVLPRFEASGVAIAIENHEGYSCSDLAHLIDDIKSPSLGVCLDSVNSLGRGEGISKVAQRLLPLTINYHVKDFTVTRGETDMGFAITGAPLGQGALDFETQIHALYKINPDANLILEQWTPLHDSVERTMRVQEEWARDGVTVLKAALERVTDKDIST